MNKMFFRLLVLLMSLSLIGIILVQVYWFNTSFKNNDEQFKFHVKQVLGNVAEKLQNREAYSFYDKYHKFNDDKGKAPEKEDVLQFYWVQKNIKTNQTIVHTNIINSEAYNINPSFVDRNKDDDLKFRSFTSKRTTEVYNNNELD